MNVKERAKCILQSVKNFFTEFADKRKSIICFALAFLSSIFLLSSGAANNSTSSYNCASYFANIVKDNSDVDNVAMIVEQTSDSVMPDTATELRGLYGAFGNRITNYAGTINASKNRSITFVDYPNNTNYSFVYIQTGVQVSASKVNENHFRAEFYPLDLMFDFYENNPLQFYSFLYISTGQARQIINYKHPGLFNESIPLSELADNPDFIKICKDELLGKGIKLSFDGVEKNYQITNIFYEDYYFYDTVYNTLGDFMVGYNQYPEGFNKQATYFLNEYEYQNEFYLSYIKEKFGKGGYDFDFCSLKYQGTFDFNSATSFLKNKTNVLSIMLLVLSISLILCSAFYMFKSRLFNLTFYFYFMLSFLLPYFIGAIIWLISKNIFFFSPYYTIAVLIYSLVVITSFIIINIIKKQVNNKEITND